MSYTIFFKETARKELYKLPAKTIHGTKKRLSEMATFFVFS
jgi:mRNA-degrading endonuclease RelE of RelBE toxin-antitoxin system